MDYPELIAKRYQVLSPLGSGASAEVFHVRSAQGDFALKLLKEQDDKADWKNQALAQNLAKIDQFKFEFSLLKNLHHPHVVRIFDFGFDEAISRFFYTQEFLLAHPLQKIASECSVEQLKELFLQSLQGLAYLHEQNILHGDLKSGNLLVVKNNKSTNKNLQLKIIDFGIAHPQLQHGGTPPYLPPEKILKQSVDERSDLYSLAVSFYEAFTGKNPFLGKSVLATLRYQLKKIPPQLTALHPEVDPVLSELLAKMMEKNPRDRPANAQAALHFMERRGQVKLQAPKALQPTWVGRAQLLQQAQEFLKSIKESSKPQVLWISGESGLGQGELLVELKYSAQLMDIEVFLPGVEEDGSLNFWEGSTYSDDKVLHKKFCQYYPKLKTIKNHSWIITVSPQQDHWVKKTFSPLKIHRLELQPLSAAEIEDFLKQVTYNKKIPAPFLRALIRWSRGYSTLLFEALRHLKNDPLLVEVSGKWNLAIYQEVEPNLEELGLSNESFDLITQSTAISEQERWYVEISRASSLASGNRFAEALEKLLGLENQIVKIFQVHKALSARAQVLERRAWIYTKQSRGLEAREQFEYALELLYECGQSKTLLALKIKNFLAYLDLQEGKIKQAIASFKENATAANQLNPLTRRKLTNNELGQAYLKAGQFKAAITQFQKDLTLFKQSNDVLLQLKAHYNLGEAFTQKAQYKKARLAFEQVERLARSGKHWEYLLRAYNGLGNVYTRQKNIAAALLSYEKSLGLAAYLKDTLAQATVAQNRGVLFSEQNKFDEALESIEISKSLLKQVDSNLLSRQLMARASHELGEIYFKQKKYASARAAYLEALNRAEEDKHLESFRFYPLMALANLAFVEQEAEEFQRLYPQLVFLAKTQDQKEQLSQLLSRAPWDPKASQSHEKNIDSKSSSPSQAALDSILKINRALLSEENPQALLNKILQYATELSGAEAALLLEVSEDQSIELKTSFNTEQSSELREVSHKVATQVLATGHSVVSADALEDANYQQFQSVVALKLRSIACIPIRLYKKVIALLYLTHRFKVGLFNEKNIQVLEAFGDQVGLVLNQVKHLAQLKELNGKLVEKLSVIEEENIRLKYNLKQQWEDQFPEVVGSSPAMREVFALIQRISATPLSVLILGETGTGKEMVARAIHKNSLVKDGPFVALNCGALPENLIESELFGYRKGAFTGAYQDKKGLLLEANGGTLFLDEVAEIPLSIQVKLLRVLQEREVTLLGDTKATSLNVRLMAATHQNIEQRVKGGTFREDLYYRMAQMILSLPPLRDRPGDLVLLSQYLLKKVAKDFGQKKSSQLDPELLQKMLHYPWPGNVRELENFLQTAMAFGEGYAIHWQDLPAFMQEKLLGQEKLETFFCSENLERKILSEKISEEQKAPELPQFKEQQTPWSHQSHWNWSQHEAAYIAQHLLGDQVELDVLADRLEISLSTLYSKIKKYQLKDNLSFWQQNPPQFPRDLTLIDFKIWIIHEAYAAHQQKVYAAAASLKLNVGTMYRYLKSPVVAI